MLLTALKDKLIEIKDFRPIGRNYEKNGALCHIAGLALTSGGELQLISLEYDEAVRDAIELEDENKAAGVCPPHPSTNREELLQEILADNFRSISSCVQSVSIGGQNYRSRHGSTTLCGSTNWQITALLTKMLLSGWEPGGFENINLDYTYITKTAFNGKYDAIPPFDPTVPIRLTFRSNQKQHQSETPVTLRAGEDYPDKLYFSDKASGERRWAQINSVTFCDLWAETESLFSDERVTSRFSPEQLLEQRAQWEEQFSRLCPRGMRLPVVGYECPEGISLRFCSARWLDAVPEHKNGATGILMKPDTPTGKLGLPLKSAVIDYPVPPDTTEIEAELFSFWEHTAEENIEI